MQQQRTHLTRMETRLVRALLAEDRIVTRDEMLAALYPDGRTPADVTVVVRVMLCRVRKFFTPNGWEIVTVWGQGYYLDPKHKADIEAWLLTSRISAGRDYAARIEARFVAAA